MLENKQYRPRRLHRFLGTWHNEGLMIAQDTTHKQLSQKRSSIHVKYLNMHSAYSTPLAAKCKIKEYI